MKQDTRKFQIGHGGTLIPVVETPTVGTMYKQGFEPINPSLRHPAHVLFACGWRTEAQLKKMKAKRERKSQTS